MYYESITAREAWALAPTGRYWLGLAIWLTAGRSRSSYDLRDRQNAWSADDLRAGLVPVVAARATPVPVPVEDTGPLCDLFANTRVMEETK
jgi:hypothetical protein